jgi:hypothetical protein
MHAYILFTLLLIHAFVFFYLQLFLLGFMEGGADDPPTVRGMPAHAGFPQEETAKKLIFKMQLPLTVGPLGNQTPKTANKFPKAIKKASKVIEVSGFG